MEKLNPIERYIVPEIWKDSGQYREILQRLLKQSGEKRELIYAEMDIFIRSLDGIMQQRDAHCLFILRQRQAMRGIVLHESEAIRIVTIWLRLLLIYLVVMEFIQHREIKNMIRRMMPQTLMMKETL